MNLSPPRVAWAPLSRRPGVSETDVTITMHNGKHMGEPITRVPVSYLRWMVDVGHTQAGDAQAELDRRGTVTPTIEISGHAIDRASQRLITFWLAETGPNREPGLHAWLVKKAEAALATIDKRPESGRFSVEVAGTRWCFVFGHSYPTLLTVTRSRKNPNRPQLDDRRACSTCGDGRELCVCKR